MTISINIPDNSDSDDSVDNADFKRMPPPPRPRRRRSYTFGQESDSDKTDSSGVHVVAPSISGSDVSSEHAQYDDWADVRYRGDIKPSDIGLSPRDFTDRRSAVPFQRPSRGKAPRPAIVEDFDEDFDDVIPTESQRAREYGRDGKRAFRRYNRSDGNDNDDNNDLDIPQESFRKIPQSSYHSSRVEAPSYLRRKDRDKGLRSPSPSSTTDTSSITIKSTISEDLTRDDRDQGAKLRYLHRQLEKRSLDLRQPRIP